MSNLSEFLDRKHDGLKEYRVIVSVDVLDREGNPVDYKGRTEADYESAPESERRIVRWSPIHHSYIVDDMDRIVSADEQATNLMQIFKSVSAALDEKAISERKGEKDGHS